MVKKEKGKGTRVFIYFSFAIAGLLLFYALYSIYSVEVIYIEGERSYIFSFDSSGFLAGITVILLMGACYLLFPDYYNKKKRSAL